MAAGEDETKTIVLHLFFLRRFIDARFELECQVTLYGVEACPPAHHVDGLEAASRYEPGARLVRKAGLRPRLQGGSESLVHGLFGEIEIPEQAHQRRQNSSRFRPVKSLYGPTQIFGRIRRHACQTSKPDRLDTNAVGCFSTDFPVIGYWLIMGRFELASQNR